MRKCDKKLLDKYKSNYKWGQTNYRDGIKYDLWKKNKLGFYNFVCYLDNLDEEVIDLAILKDVRKK